MRIFPLPLFRKYGGSHVGIINCVEFQSVDFARIASATQLRPQYVLSLDTQFDLKGLGEGQHDHNEGTAMTNLQASALMIIAHAC